jgi:4'-phosphopantetheinyl transferase
MKASYTSELDAPWTLPKTGLPTRRTARTGILAPEILFDPAPRNLEAVNGEAHVFGVTLDQPSSRLEFFGGILSADERARAARFVFARHRNRFVARRGMLREILGRLLRADPAHLVFTCGAHGKPRLATPVGGRLLHFNLAHSDALAVYVVSAQSEVGVDVERIRPVPEAGEIASRFFSPREYRAWRVLRSRRRLEAFLHCWTRHESLLKAVGIGLCGSLDQSEAPLLHGCATQRRASAGVAAALAGFSLHPLAVARGYQAVAATRSVNAPCCWQWPPRTKSGA